MADIRCFSDSHSPCIVLSGALIELAISAKVCATNMLLNQPALVLGARCEDAQAGRLPQMPLLQHILCQQAVQVGVSALALHDCFCLTWKCHILVWTM